jgi:hypothetical protein
MATTYVRIDRDVQVSEATTNRRSIHYTAGVAEAQSFTIRKAGGGTTFGASSGGTVNLIYGTVYELQPSAADLDTEGQVVFKCWGATAETVLYGLRVVQHDPFADVASILDDTGTSGVALPAGGITAAKFGAGALTSNAFAAGAIGTTALATGAIGPAALANYVNALGGVEFQLNEAETTKRVLLYRVGVAEAQTITVSKNAGTVGASASTATQVSGTLYKLSIDAGDLDTKGRVSWVSTGASGAVAINGVSVVGYDPEDDLNYMARNAGKGLLVYDTSAGTITTYDGSTTAYAVLGTQSRSTTATEVIWTPG